MCDVQLYSFEKNKLGEFVPFCYWKDNHSFHSSAPTRDSIGIQNNSSTRENDFDWKEQTVIYILAGSFQWTERVSQPCQRVSLPSITSQKNDSDQCWIHQHHLLTPLNISTNTAIHTNLTCLEPSPLVLTKQIDSLSDSRIQRQLSQIDVTESKSSTTNGAQMSNENVSYCGMSLISSGSSSETKKVQQLRNTSRCELCRTTCSDSNKSSFQMKGNQKKYFGRSKSSWKQKFRRRGYVRFSKEEEQNLLKGISLFGAGHWKLILSSFEFHHKRTCVDLKDKYRNILKTSSRRKHSNSQETLSYTSTSL